MSKYYGKNFYSPVSRTQYIGRQRAEREISHETKQIPRRFHDSIRELNGWKCDECGIVLKDNHKMLRIHFAKVFCIGCHAEQRGKGHRKLKKKRIYKRFMEIYGKEWRRRCKGNINARIAKKKGVL